MWSHRDDKERYYHRERMLFFINECLENFFNYFLNYFINECLENLLSNAFFIMIFIMKNKNNSTIYACWAWWRVQANKILYLYGSLSENYLIRKHKAIQLLFDARFFRTSMKLRHYRGGLNNNAHANFNFRRCTLKLLWVSLLKYGQLQRIIYYTIAHTIT